MNFKNIKTVILGVLFVSAASQVRAEERYVNCSSSNERFSRCSVGAEIDYASLWQQRSQARCVEGSTWGYDRDSIWVDRGCRATFRVQVRPRDYLRETRINCGSSDRRYNSCEVGGRIVDARIIDQRSDAACEYGRSWGYNHDSIWVDRGCRATFSVSYYPRRRY